MNTPIDTDFPGKVEQELYAPILPTISPASSSCWIQQ